MGGQGPKELDLRAVGQPELIGYEDRITITPKDPDMRLLEVTAQEGFLILATTAGLIPFLIALLGGLIWRQRRNRI